MRKAILIRFLLIIVLALVICCSVTGYFISKSMLDTTVQDMYQTLHVLEHSLNYDENLQENLLTITNDVFTEEMRVTIVNAEGIVVADSSVEDIKSLENHLGKADWGWQLCDSSVGALSGAYRFRQKIAADYYSGNFISNDCHNYGRLAFIRRDYKANYSYQQRDGKGSED